MEPLFISLGSVSEERAWIWGLRLIPQAPTELPLYGSLYVSDSPL